MKKYENPEDFSRSNKFSGFFERKKFTNKIESKYLNSFPYLQKIDNLENLNKTKTRINFEDDDIILNKIKSSKII